MILLVNRNDDVIIAVVTTAEHVQNGIHVDKDLVDESGYKIDSIYSNLNDEIELVSVETIPDGIEPYKHRYNVELGFHDNPDFVQHITPEQKITQLEATIESMKATQTEQDALIMSLLLGGA